MQNFSMFIGILHICVELYPLYNRRLNYMIGRGSIQIHMDHGSPEAVVSLKLGTDVNLFGSF